MKKIKIFGLALIPVILLSAISCKSNTTDPEAIDSFQERRIACYATPASLEQVDNLSIAESYSFYYINNSSIPYVSIKEFIDYFLLGGNFNYEKFVVTEGTSYIITNPVNDAYLELNLVENKAIYHNFDMFSSTASSNTMPYVGSVFGNPAINNNITTYEYYEGAETFTVNLSDYNMKTYYHRNEAYVPYLLACTLFDDMYTRVFAYTYDALYGYSGNVNEINLALNNLIRSKGLDWLTDEYLAHNYDNLALELDMYYGLDERNLRTENKTQKYLEGGAYKTLEPYREKLVSKDLDVSNDALVELFANELDDGGHDKYVSTNILSTKLFERIDVCGKESANTFAYENGIQEARKNKGTRIEDLFPNKEDANGYYKEYGDVAYILFDEFTMLSSGYNTLEITDDNYMLDSITLFNYANKKIQENKNIKDVIIDISANGGGVMFAAEFISSWVCGGTNDAICNNKTGSMMKYNIKADVNFDGVFDSNDYLDPDINVYVMISEGSFSCGNKLPCNIADSRKQNTFFIGSQTGGGSCAVINLPTSFLGGQVRISRSLQSLRYSSTYDNRITNEDGVKPDFYSIEGKNYDAYDDIDTIVSKIIQNRNHN